MSRFWIQDVQAILRGLQTVSNATIKTQEANFKVIWQNSSLRSLAEGGRNGLDRTVQKIYQNPVQFQNTVANKVTESLQRSSMVLEGLTSFTKHSSTVEWQPASEPQSAGKELSEEDLLDLASRHLREDSLSKPIVPLLVPNAVLPNVAPPNVAPPNVAPPNIAPPKASPAKVAQRVAKPKVVLPKQALSVNAKAREVPATRIGRLMSFGGLAAGLGIGTVAEVTRRALKGEAAPTTLDSAFLSPANAERIVNTLCKVRGAALKIGQILSIQDNSVISPGLQKTFERVRQSADFMPTWQVEQVLIGDFGEDWRSKVKCFESTPFAAASIGQVHQAQLLDGTNVAMKIQYPGVARGIESDIDNLVSILKVWNIFPEGFFIDNLVEVAKRELAWEVDYIREAECTTKVRQLLEPYPDYLVPRVINSLSSKQVITTEMIEGISVDKCTDMDLETRQHIASRMMELTCREIFQFRYVQTDPNWANFFYNPQTRQIMLLDFGACRSYDKEFMDIYINIVKGAADGRRDIVLKLSHEIGFLTGYESKLMSEAHVDAVMILGEVFSSSKKSFNFGAQDTTRRIQHLVPTMIKHRLRPPPEEIYSLHRKLSGVFLLCAKLDVTLECRSMFQQLYNNYH